jgi:hypothetical protein
MLNMIALNATLRNLTATRQNPAAELRILKPQLAKPQAAHHNINVANILDWQATPATVNAKLPKLESETSKPPRQTSKPHG